MLQIFTHIESCNSGYFLARQNISHGLIFAHYCLYKNIPTMKIWHSMVSENWHSDEWLNNYSNLAICLPKNALFKKYI